MAAEQGHPDAQYNLGVMYVNGEGVPENDAEAVKWFRKSAEQGYVDAQRALGILYQDGSIELRDDQEALKWLGLASEAGDGQAIQHLERLQQHMAAPETAEIQNQTCEIAEAPSRPLEVVKFVQGKIKFEEAGETRLCASGAELTYNENGTCNVGGVDRPCLWFGYELEYRTSRPFVPVECVTRSSEQLEWVDGKNKEVIGMSSEQTSTFQLDGCDTKFVQVMNVYGLAGHESVLEFDTKCEAEDETVLEFQFRIIPRSDCRESRKLAGPPSALPVPTNSCS